ncbi:MAG: domain S-box, partial [Myxococcaceae bacterium]|nr:domain S-box [Myxococcaceae bacterium]
MPRITTPAPGNTISSRVSAFVQHLERYREVTPRLRLVPAERSADPAVLREALERLELEHEELVIAEEELRVQLDAVAAVERTRTNQGVQYREIFDFSPDPLIVTDREASVLEANLAALQMLSIDVRNLQNKPMVTLVDRAAWPDFFAAVATVGAERGVELTLDLKGRRGAECRVALRGALSRDGTRILWSA